MTIRNHSTPQEPRDVGSAPSRRCPDKSGRGCNGLVCNTFRAEKATTQQGGARVARLVVVIADSHYK